MSTSNAPESRLDFNLLLHPAEHFDRDVALFAAAGLVVFAFGPDATAELMRGFGWRGALEAAGVNPEHAFARHYLNGAVVVAAWRGSRGERPS